MTRHVLAQRANRLRPGGVAATLSMVACGVVLAIYPGANPAAAQVRDQSRPREDPAGIIRGRITAADSGSVLRRAQVRLIAPASRQTIVTTTDADGSYEFRGLNPGQYALVASKGGFVQTQYGQRRAFVAGTPIELKAGQTLDQMDIRLAPGASVDGRVFDEYGEPIADAMVMTLRGQYAGGRKRVVNVGRVLTTNERGEFHLFGLPAGNYYLSATLMSGQNMSDAATRAGYAPTYYPGNSDIAAAETIALIEGEQRSGLMLTLDAVRTATLSGSAFDSDHRPLGGGVVTVVNSVSGFPIPIASAPISSDGAFLVANVPPGRFTVHATSNSTASGAAPEVATQAIAVAGQDLSGLTLLAPKPGIVSGVLTRAAGETDPLPQAMQLRIVAARPAEDLVAAGTLVRANADGSFHGASRPGAVLIELAGAPPGWHIKQILQRGADVTDSGIRLSAGDSTDGVEVVLTRSPTTVSGTVVDSTKRPVHEYSVAIFSKDRNRWGYRSRYVSAARPNQQGIFSIKGLPPGEYLAVAVDYLEQGEDQDQTFLESVLDLAKLVTLGDAETQTVVLTLTKRQ